MSAAVRALLWLLAGRLAGWLHARTVPAAQNGTDRTKFVISYQCCQPIRKQRHPTLEHLNGAVGCDQRLLSCGT